MKKILIIEDDTEAQETYEELLSNKYHLFLAATPQLGLTIASREKPDLIILDLLLPGLINGMETLKKLKKNRVIGSIPVVVVSNVDSEKQEAMKHGAHAFMGKASTSIETLLATVKRYAEHT